MYFFRKTSWIIIKSYVSCSFLINLYWLLQTHVVFSTFLLPSTLLLRFLCIDWYFQIYVYTISILYSFPYFFILTIYNTSKLSSSVSQQFYTTQGLKVNKAKNTSTFCLRDFENFLPGKYLLRDLIHFQRSCT